jgi:hypothetical protein
MLALVALSERTLAASPFYLEWDPILLLALGSSGWMCGFVLAVNGRIGRFFDEMTGIRHGAVAAIGLPVGGLTVVASMISLYAGFLLYAVLGAMQKVLSNSVLCAFGASAAIVAFFTMVAQSSAIYSGGSSVFLSHLLGWVLGDLFR